MNPGRLLGIAVVSFLLMGTLEAATVEWTPRSVVTSIGGGSSVDPAVVTFTSESRLESVTVEVVPELADFVSVEPAEFAEIVPGRTYSVTLSFSVAPYALPGPYAGTIHLVERGRRTIARPLPVEIDLAASDAVISSRTKALTKAALGTLVEVTRAETTSLRFLGNSRELDALAPGNVLVIPPHELLPDGLLGEIVHVGVDGDSYVIETVPASLGDAFVDLDLSISRVLKADAAAKVTGAKLLKPTAGGTFGEDWVLSIDDVPIYDHDGNGATTDDQIVASAEVAFITTVDFDIVLHDSQLEKARFVAEFTKQETLSVRAAISEDLLDESCLILRGPDPDKCHILSRPQIYIRPIVFWIGWVPVVITPIINGVVGIEGSVTLGFETSLSTVTTLTAGAVYQNGQTDTIGDVSIDFDWDPISVVYEMSAKAFFGPKLDIYLYGGAGPGIVIDIFVEADVEPLAEPWWTLWGGVEVDVTLSMVKLYEKEFEGVVSFKKLLAQAEKKQCNVAPTNIGPGTVFVTGGSLAGQPVGPANWTVNVSPGAPISGSVQVRATNSMGPSAVAPLGYTWTWGDRTTSLVWSVGSIPPGVTNWNLPINLTAPTTAGTYYILVAYRGEFTIAQVMSATNWSAGAVRWNDGNDLVDADECRLQYAQEHGVIPDWRLGYATMYLPLDQPAAPIRIIVK